jgi:hypothetical protein
MIPQKPFTTRLSDPLIKRAFELGICVSEIFRESRLLHLSSKKDSTAFEALSIYKKALQDEVHQAENPPKPVQAQQPVPSALVRLKQIVKLRKS